MAANTYLQLTELDFDQIRGNLKTYLSGQDQFKDYNFEGSAISVLLDLLAYNTHYNAYYLNMVGNELFLDTAQQRDSIVSLAKTLGYVPTSARGSSASVQLSFSGVSNTIGQFVISKNSTFNTTIEDITYTFVTPEAYTVINSSNTFIKTITIREGTPTTHRFAVDAENPIRYILPNANVDSSSIVVKVQNSTNDTTVVEYTRATNVKQIFNTSTVYFLEEAGDGKYEIVFGSGSLGKSLVGGNIVIVDYLVCSGESTNGANTFTVESVTTDTPYSSVDISLVSKASGGRPAETAESIKFNAPRSYQTQNRAVVAEDYQRIITAENADIQSVVAYGGEQAEPAVFGKVYIAVKPFGEQYVTQTRKQELRASVLERAILSVDPEFIDAKYTYIIPTVTTNYNRSKTVASDGQIQSAVRTAIANFSSTELERFGNKFRFSKFVRSLDNISTVEILNNDVSLVLENRFIPNIQTAERVLVKFNNSLRAGTLSSTSFTFLGFSAFLDDDSLGNVRIYRFNSSRQKVFIDTTAGTVDYKNGTINIEGFAPTAYSGIEMKIYATPATLDIAPQREQILILNSTDAVITPVAEIV